MSATSINNFLEKINNDEQLQTVLMEAKGIDAFVSLGRQNGFEFSPTEAKVLFDDMAQMAAALEAQSDEVDDSDLEAVSGGFGAGAGPAVAGGWAIPRWNLGGRRVGSPRAGQVYGPLSSV